MAYILKKPNRAKAANPLRDDPSQTGPLRRAFMQQLKNRLNVLKKRVWEFVAVENVFGLGLPDTTELRLNTRFRFNTTADQLKVFVTWLHKQMGELFFPEEDNSWWLEYVRKGWLQGANRVYKAWRQPSEFLNTSFNLPAPLEKVKLLAGRVLTELKNVTHDMATKMSRALTDGLSQGKNPREVAKDINAAVDMNESRALAIAQTETVRAHAEGQLDALENLGMEQVGVAVEWSTSHLGHTKKWTTGRGKNKKEHGGYPSPCPQCAPMQGVVFSLSEARGMIPRHPNCRCSFIPANVGESPTKQTRSYTGISQALKQSLKAELPKVKKRSLAEQAELSNWPGAKLRVSKRRPE